MDNPSEEEIIWNYYHKLMQLNFDKNYDQHGLASAFCEYYLLYFFVNGYGMDG